MVILQDSREQNPLEFPKSRYPYVENVRVEKLDVGDYMVEYIDGYRPKVSFERKNLQDLFSTLTSGHKRFKKEIERAKDNDIQLILVIEGTMSRVLNGSDYSTVKGIKILRVLITMWLRYGLSFMFFKGRDEMSKFIYEYFCGIGRIKGNKRVDK